jgi:hypothetical protein
MKKILRLDLEVQSDELIYHLKALKGLHRRIKMSILLSAYRPHDNF